MDPVEISHDQGHRLSLYDRFVALSDWRRLAVGASAAALFAFVFAVILLFNGSDDDTLFMCLIAFWATLGLSAYGTIGAATEEGRLTRPLKVFAIGAAVLAGWFGTILLTFLFDHLSW